MKLHVLAGKLNYHLRKQLRMAALRAGFRKLLLTPKPATRILVYHGIDHIGRTDLNSRFISQARFREEMLWLQRNATVVSLADYFAGNFPQDRFVVALTFDDGYRNNHDLAAPILHELGLPATFFVTASRQAGQDHLWLDALDLTALYRQAPWEVGGIVWVKQKGEFRHVQTGERLKTWAIGQGSAGREWVTAACGEAFKARQEDRIYWELMTEEHLQALARAPLFEIGAHSVLHDNYAAMPDAELAEDLRVSKDWLTQVSGTPVVSLAYPFGLFNSSVHEAAAAAGFTRLLTLDGQTWASRDGNCKQMGRFGTNPYISTQLQRVAFIQGKY